MAHLLRWRVRPSHIGGGLPRDRRLSSMVILCLALAGCEVQVSQALSDADETAVRDGVESVLSAANAQDFAAWAEIYADDAVLLPPNGPTVESRAAIREWLMMLPPTSDWKLEIAEIDGVGDLAYVRGGYSLMITPPGLDAPVADQGKFIQIWRKQAGGSWKAVREIFNSNLPAPISQ